MYRHKNKGNGIITVTDDEGKHHIFTPGSIITLNRVYKEIEKYGIVCTNPDEKKESPAKRTGNRTKEENKEDD